MGQRTIDFEVTQVGKHVFIKAKNGVLPTKLVIWGVEYEQIDEQSHNYTGRVGIFRKVS